MITTGTKATSLKVNDRILLGHGLHKIISVVNLSDFIAIEMIRDEYISKHWFRPNDIVHALQSDDN